MHAWLRKQWLNILIVNDGAGDGGGVETYLRSVASGLRALGHEVVFGHCGGDTSGIAPFVSQCILLDQQGKRPVPARMSGGDFDICYSHNMRFLELEAMLLRQFPVVKFMHGYFGTCISGLKSTSLSQIRTCQRRLGIQCFAHYFIRGCGQRSLGACFGGFKWARRQQQIWRDYSAVVVASAHMRREYLHHGLDPDQITTIPLFGEKPSTTLTGRLPQASYRTSDDFHRFLFIGRMTALKGPQLLPEAVSVASRELGVPVKIDFIGDGPVLARCKEEATKYGVECLFHGWLEGEQKLRLFDQSCGLLISSLWPEPFGLVGLEVARFGMPSVAFNVGGISEWLDDGINGVIAKSDPPTATSMGSAIVKLIRDEDKWKSLSSGAIRKADELTLDRHVRRLLSVFDQVLN